jgi:hypothetical protein
MYYGMGYDKMNEGDYFQGYTRENSYCGNKNGPQMNEKGIHTKEIHLLQSGYKLCSFFVFLFHETVSTAEMIHQDHDE